MENNVDAISLDDKKRKRTTIMLNSSKLQKQIMKYSSEIDNGFRDRKICMIYP